MPPDFQPWLEYLGKGDLEAPVALAACDETRLISFYPLADFSPELAAIRWAAAHNVPVIPCDLALTAMGRLDRLRPDTGSRTRATNRAAEPAQPLRRARQRRAVGKAGRNAGEQVVSRGDSPGGAVLRLDGPPFVERAVRCRRPSRSGDAGGGGGGAEALGRRGRFLSRRRAVAGADPVVGPGACRERRRRTRDKPATSLIPYSFAQLDQRSGYPAGVMDPVWQQTMLAATDPEAANRLIADLAVELCRHLRSEGHVAGTPDATEIVRLARDLSRLRGHAAPGRGELLEAIETSLVQGDLLGRGRAVAAAAQAVLVGKQRGRLPKGTPRSGLAVQVEAAIARLKLPGPEPIDEEPRELRLDPLRSRLDRGRAVLFRRLNLVGIHYAQRLDTEGIGNRENLTEAWQVQWTGATTATVEAAGIHGVTLVQASEAAVRRLRQPDAADADDDQPERQHPATTLARLSAAAECGLGDAVKALLAQLDGPFLHSRVRRASDRSGGGHAAHCRRPHAGLPLREDDAAPPDVELFEARPELLNAQPLLEAALRGLDGLRGSDEPADVVALVDLTAMIRGDLRQDAQDAQRTFAPLARTEVPPGPPAARGLAANAGSGLGRPGDAGGRSTWTGSAPSSRAGTTAASTSEGRGQLRSRLQGLMVPLLPLVSSDPDWLSGLEGRLAASADDEFLARLPALRGGFQTLTPADRARLLSDRLAVLEPGGPAATAARRIDDPVALACATAADRAGRAAIARLLPDFALREPGKSDAHAAHDSHQRAAGRDHLGRSLAAGPGRERLQQCRKADAPRRRSISSTAPAPARAADRRDDLAGRGGTEAASPSAREWINDVNGLFGKDVCEEVLGEAAAGGRAAVLEHLNPDTVRPSVDLLEQVLALRGALPERELSQLRKLARRITERLAEQLANRLRPALSGLSTARPTRRRSRRLDFARTLDTNLDTAYRRERRPHRPRAAAHDLPHAGPPAHGLASDLRGGRVRVDGSVRHLQRPGGRHLLGAAGHRRPVLRLQHRGHRFVALGR